MTRAEYSEALRKELWSLDPELRADLLREMESHIDALMERNPGQDEAAIVESLSSPAALAAGLIEELGLAPSPHAGSAGKPLGAEAGKGSGPDREGGEARSEGREETEEEGPGRGSRRKFTIHIDSEEIDRSVREGLHGLGDTIRSALHGALRGYAGGLKRERFSFEDEIDSGGAEELELEFTQCDIELRPGRGPGLELRIEVEGEAAELEGFRPLIERTGTTLRLADAGSTNALSLSLGFPASIRRLGVKTTSGEVDIDAGGRDCVVTSRSGDLEIRRGGALELRTSSGGITVEDCRSLSAESTSGDIEIEAVSGLLRAASSSGGISIAEAEGRVEAKTSSGDIELELAGPSVLAHTSSGSITVSAEEGFEGGELGTSSGDIEVELEGGDLEIRAESVSGDINFDGEEAEDRVPRRMRTRLGQGGCLLELRTVSGDIEVSWD
jgi:hypothetical protein